MIAWFVSGADVEKKNFMESSNLVDFLVVFFLVGTFRALFFGYHLFSTMSSMKPCLKNMLIYVFKDPFSIGNGLRSSRCEYVDRSPTFLRKTLVKGHFPQEITKKSSLFWKIFFEKADFFLNSGIRFLWFLNPHGAIFEVVSNIL